MLPASTAASQWPVAASLLPTIDSPCLLLVDRLVASHPLLAHTSRLRSALVHSSLALTATPPSLTHPIRLTWRGLTQCPCISCLTCHSAAFIADVRFVSFFRVSPARSSAARPSSAAAAQRVKRSRDNTSPSQRQSKRRSASAAVAVETATDPALPNGLLPVPPAPTAQSSHVEARESKTLEKDNEVEVDDDWGSLVVEEDTLSQQDEEQADNNQQRETALPTDTNEPHTQQSEITPSASTSDTAPNSLASDEPAVPPAALPTTKSSLPNTAVASRMALMRLQSDLKSLEHDPPEGISASPLDPNNLLVWRACIFGPSDTPWVSHTLRTHNTDTAQALSTYRHCVTQR